MKGCSNWMEAIADCALGKAASPKMAAHLAVCPLCQDGLRESSAMAARIDAALRRSAAVEPPLYGPERLLARIRGQADTRAWWRWAAAGSAVLAVIIAIVLWVRHPASKAEITALSTWRSPTQWLLRPPVAAAWTPAPRPGEGHFKMKPMGETYAK
jgi:hypothetical protein